jgi:glc operon protein GlcG
MLSKPALDHEDAVQILQAARDEALSQQWPVSIAVCDDGGHLMAFVRLDGANLASARISQAKARTAAMMKRDTVLIEDMIKNGRTAFLSAPDLDGMLEGGVAIVVDGHCVGAVGVSGVKAPEDAQVGKAGVAAWQAGLAP